MAGGRKTARNRAVLSPYENFARFAAPGALEAWDPCGAPRVRAIWEEAVGHALGADRAAEFMSRHECASLAQMHPDDVEVAAREAQSANNEGHLLLDEWFVVGMRLRRKRIAKRA